MVEVRRFKVLRFRQGHISLDDDEVVVEQPIHLYVNGRHLVTFLASPSNLRELAYGHLASEGIIKSINDVDEIVIEDFKIKVKLPNTLMTRVKLYNTLRIRFTSCGEIDSGFLRLLDSLSRREFSSKLHFKVEDIFEAVRLLNTKSTLYRRTGGVHVAMLLDSKLNVAGFAEDVGRHNAVDKAVGAAMMNGFILSELFMVCSGRLSSEMVLKAIRLNVPLIASISAPTALGVVLAKRAKLTLIGFVRGKRMNVYSCPERLSLSCKGFHDFS
ncbi:MAG: formate dehydrogenase accessory sulfurtransferase FdhD [archaeon GB-1867-035]|nr:formate dehydrogenase accessory sulfurtransferase FdhD [Candidatus Culexmicrobium profundum]